MACQVAAENVLGEVSREIFRHVAGAMRADARLLPGYEDARLWTSTLEI